MQFTSYKSFVFAALQINQDKYSDKVISIWGNVAPLLIVSHYNAEMLVADSNKDSFSPSVFLVYW